MLKGNRRPLAELKRKIELIDNYEQVPTRYDLSTNYKFKLQDLNLNSNVDSICLVNKELVIRVFEVSDRFVVGRRYLITDDQGRFRNFYHKPFPSSKANIYLSEGLSNITEKWPITDCKIVSKCIVLPHDDEYVVFPLLHTK